MFIRSRVMSLEEIKEEIGMIITVPIALIMMAMNSCAKSLELISVLHE